MASRRRVAPSRSNPLASRTLPSILQGSHGGPLALAEPTVAPRRDGQPAARGGDGRALGAAAVCGGDPPIRKRGDFRQDRRECARPGCVHYPADQPPGGEQSGAAVPNRRRAARITAVLPYFGYARQDRKDQPRVAISAKLMANLITAAGADRVLGMDFHSHQLQGFFDIPVDHLYAAPVFVSHFRQKQLYDPVVVAPDVGSAKMARGFAKRLNASLAIIDKRRPSANVAEVVNVVGEVADKDCLIPDDMIDTAGTVTEAAAALKGLGARKIYAFASHALLSGPAVERLRASAIDEVAVTNTIRIPEERQFERLEVLSIAGLMAKAIGYEHSNQSVSSLFD